MNDLEKLICYRHPKRNHPLDSWEVRVIPIPMEETTHTITYNKKRIELTSTGGSMRIDSVKAGMPDVTGFIECEFFDAPWRQLGMI